MADETTENPQETPAENAAAAAPVEDAAPAEGANDDGGLGDLDLMDVFSEDDEVNEDLFVITRGLADIAIGEVMGDLREVGEIIRIRRGR